MLEERFGDLSRFARRAGPQPKKTGYGTESVPAAPLPDPGARLATAPHLRTAGWASLGLHRDPRGIGIFQGNPQLPTCGDDEIQTRILSGWENQVELIYCAKKGRQPALTP